MYYKLMDQLMMYCFMLLQKLKEKKNAGKMAQMQQDFMNEIGTLQVLELIKLQNYHENKFLSEKIKAKNVSVSDLAAEVGKTNNHLLSVTR